MVAFYKCLACQGGNCNGCHKGHTVPGLLGGWRCSCDCQSKAA